MTSLFLIVTIAGQRVMLSAASVESVVEIDEIEPVPLVAPHVAGLFALRSRVLTVIDSAAAIGKAASTVQSEAVIVNCEGHGYAILVENVDDVVEIDAAILPAPAVLTPPWARVALGVLDIEGDALLVVDPAGLVSGPQNAAAA